MTDAELNAASETEEAEYLVDAWLKVGVYDQLLALAMFIVKVRRDAVAVEREACAKAADSVAESAGGFNGRFLCEKIAAAIRARGDA